MPENDRKYEKDSNYSYVPFYSMMQQDVENWVKERTDDWEILVGPDIPDGVDLAVRFCGRYKTGHVEALKSDLDQEEVEDYFETLGCYQIHRLSDEERKDFFVNFLGCDWY